MQTQQKQNFSTKGSSRRLRQRQHTHKHIRTLMFSCKMSLMSQYEQRERTLKRNQQQILQVAEIKTHTYSHSLTIVRKKRERN